PGLQHRLVDQRLDALQSASQQYSGDLRRALGSDITARRVNTLVRQTGDASRTRVTVFLVASGSSLSLTSAYDSFAETHIRDLDFPPALEAARTGRLQRGTEAGDDGRVGEVALPLFFRRPDGRRAVSYVVVYSTALRDVAASVTVVRQRLLLAGLVALVIAFSSGLLGARALSSRVRTLEEAAKRVAGGDFTARFPLGRADELGQLSRTLDGMRLQLAELDSARKRFIATASHELRTPIFSLGGFVELLQDEELDAETRDRFLSQIREQVARLGKLATDLLDLSRLEAGSLELRSESTDLSALASDVAGEFEPALQQHDSRLELRVPATPVHADCDPERVAQVMRILIDNALTHTPPGTDMVVSAQRRDSRVRLGVGDFGPGIHRTMLPHIFEPFITSDDAQGSGLGLAIAHELAERMEGELIVESQPGRTTFTLELPAR
ncbi:MAG: two-component system, OmpR family, sensor kinase, partial [Solirubrobacteraceae bacterium]|nr:two-component system, OmpR family, sensor kinase [Solirubrobacteraceae bacterium]